MTAVGREQVGANQQNVGKGRQGWHQRATPAVFGLDLIGAGTTVETIPHFRDKGLDSLMSDGSVHFNKKPQVWALASQGNALRNDPTAVDRLCNLIDGGP